MKLLLATAVIAMFAASTFAQTTLPADGRYVMVKDGHLTVAGQRVRYWGCVGSFPGKTAADNDAVARRLADMGFNMVRYWRNFNEPAEYTKGDGSEADRTDQFIAACGANGIRIWLAGLGNVGDVKADDVAVLDDPATADAWKAAIVEMSAGGKKKVGLHGRENPARVWDKRLEALAIKRMTNTATHLNQHTGLRWADDPAIGIWELSNEEWWFKRMNEGRFQKLPAFFINELLEQWNAFLREKYGSEDKLRAAWLGLLPGESLKEGTILLLPLKTPLDPTPQQAAILIGELGKSVPPGEGKTVSVLVDTSLSMEAVDPSSQPSRRDIINMAATQAGNTLIVMSDGRPSATTAPSPATANVPVMRVSVPSSGPVVDAKATAPDANPANVVMADASAGRKYGPDDFNAARAADVIEFLLKIQVAHKQREADAIKPLGKSTRLCAMVWDTGVGNEMQSQYIQQFGDAIAHCQYQQGIGWDPTDRRFPWRSMLEEAPRLSPNREWETVEHPRHPDKPFLMYENQIHNPAKYRAEYPMLVASLGAVQDHDAIIWHYFGGVPDSTQERPYDKAMDYSSSQNPHPQGFHFQYDAVQMSSMAAAAEVFKNGALEPAPKPTTFIFGRKSLHNIRMVNYGDVAPLFLPTTYRYGVRLLIDPKRDDDEIVGPTYYSRYYEPNPYAPTRQITYDRQNGCLMFDSPSAAMFVGFLASRPKVGTTTLKMVSEVRPLVRVANAGPAPVESVAFASGVQLSDVCVRNDEGIAYPVKDDERFVEFALASCDGLPLEKTKRARLSLVSTSFNSGFKLDESKLRERFWWSGKGATVSLGKLPVLHARVGAHVAGAAINGMTYRMLDWHMNQIASGKVEGSSLVIPADKPVFIVELAR